jgi:hypothetical protein
MGMYNTGTNLLHYLLATNFGHQIGWYRSDRTQEDPKSCWVWKHSNLDLVKGGKVSGCHDTVALAMVRNPLAWLHSMKREAYDLNVCTRHCPEAPDGHHCHSTRKYKMPQEKDWLTKSCQYAKVNEQVALSGKAFDNIETIWSEWTRQFDSLSSYGFNRTMVIRYEDLVMDTEGVLAKIASLANLTLPAKVRQIEMAVNPSIHVKNERQLAIEQIKNRSFLEMYKEPNSTSLASVCARLDVAAMRRHGYTDCDEVVM